MRCDQWARGLDLTTCPLTLGCTITDPGTGNTFALTATFAGRTRGEGFRDRNDVIGEQVG